jgi:hypothetical protein
MMNCLHVIIVDYTKKKYFTDVVNDNAHNIYERGVGERGWRERERP